MRIIKKRWFVYHFNDIGWHLFTSRNQLFHHYFLEIYVRTHMQNLHVSFILQRIHFPIPQKAYLKKQLQNKEIQTPPQVTENRPSSKTLIFVTYSFPKSDHWTPPWNPPGRPKRSQNLPRKVPRTLRALRGPSRTTRTSWELQNLRTGYI